MVLKIPPTKVAFIQQGLTLKDKDMIVDAFQERMNDAGTELKYENFRPRYLVGVASCLSYGLNLTRAVHITLLEPHYLRSVELQIYKRHNRMGQQNSRTYTARLLIKGDATEGRILTRHMLRGHLGTAMEATRTSPHEAEEGGEGTISEGPINLISSSSSSSSSDSDDNDDKLVTR
jgi:hypothetical protein